MKKEYIAPEIKMIAIQLNAPILVFSEESAVIEDFDVSDGEW